MSNYLSQSWLLNRRHALRALGSFISLPFLECMVPLRAAENAAEAPKRSSEAANEEKPRDICGGWRRVLFSKVLSTSSSPQMPVTHSAE
jgi:hypothetical protein